MSPSSPISFLLLTFLVCTFFPSFILCCGGSLAVVYRAADISSTACYFSHLNFQNGYLFNVSRVDDICADRDILPDNLGIGHTAYDSVSGLFFYTSGNGQFIWAIKKMSGNFSQFATLPAQYSEVIGLDIVTLADSSSMVVMTTIDSIYGAPIVLSDSQGMAIALKGVPRKPKTMDEACDPIYSSVQQSFVVAPSDVKLLVSLSSVSISPDAVSTASDTDTVFIISGLSLFSINLSTPPVQNIPTFALKSSNDSEPLATIMDVQYHVNYADRNDDRIVVIDSYRLFFIDPLSGSAEFIAPIPDGPGFPRCNALFGDQFFFSDFYYVYVMTLTYDHAIDPPQPFNSYYALGNFQAFF